MFVIVDLEWVERMDGGCHPTQLAAARVDEAWQMVDAFSVLIRPEITDCDWRHMAFSGADEEDFLAAPYAGDAFAQFVDWLEPEDVLCWWSQFPAAVFELLMRAYVGRETEQPGVVVVPYFSLLVHDGHDNMGNPYRLAAMRGIELPRPSHAAANDVMVLCQLFAKVQLSQSGLLEPLPENAPRESSKYAAQEAFYDPATQLVHRRGCPELVIIEGVKGYKNLAGCTKLGHQPCPVCCTAEDWKEAIRERNREIVAKSKLEFFHLRGSKVFHRGTCHKLLNSSHDIFPVTKYKTCIKRGRAPCKLCKPEAPPEMQPTQKKKKHKKKQRKAVQVPFQAQFQEQLAAYAQRLSGDELAAYTRYEAALTDRKSVNRKELAKDQRRDRMTLASSSFVFFTGHDHELFHLRDCPELQQLSGIYGYARYQTAIRHGKTPCPMCMPTQEHSIRLSIPINSRFRGEEGIEDLLALCQEKGMESEYEKPMLSLSTPVACWRMNVELFPIILEHRPIWQENFHQQHRMFLSATDAIRYIAKHDKVKRGK